MKKLLSTVGITALLFGLVGNVFAAQESSQNVNITTTVADVLTFTVSSNTVALGTITPGTPVTGTVTAQVVTNAQGGFVLYAQRADADTTLDHTTDAASNITDKTALDYLAENSALWAGTGLGFRVNKTGTTASNRSDTLWGTDDTVGNAKFAGFPATYEPIQESTSYASTQQDVVIGVKLDVPSTQKTGNYDGTINLRVNTGI